MSLSKTLYPLFGNGSTYKIRPDMTAKVVDWDVKNKSKRNHQATTSSTFRCNCAADSSRQRATVSVVFGKVYCTSD